MESIEQKLGFDRIREQIRSRCQSSLAASLAEEEQFSSNEAEIRKRLNLTEEMRLILMFEDSFPSSGYIDSLDFLQPLEQEGSSTDIVSLRKLRTMLDTIGRLRHFFDKAQEGMYPNLRSVIATINYFPAISQRMDSILDRYGNIKDNASDELRTIRAELASKGAQLSKRAAACLRKAQQDGLVGDDVSLAVRDGRYLIPVPAAAKHQVAGFIYDESASGKTSFIEPAEVVALTNEIKELEFAEEREILKILFEFCEFLRPYVPDLILSARRMALIDFLIAKGQVAIDMIAGLPVFSSDGCVRLRKARHPLLESALRKEGRTIVPLTITLTPQKRILLVSGPNAGGKSVCLKTMGLLQYMFQWGMLIPTSEASEMLVFDRVEACIGDDQSIDNDLSTYSSFLTNMKEILGSAGHDGAQGASGRRLVLIDEFGSGTEPAAGGAIAEAILARLEALGVYGVITTHYTNLKMYASRPGSAVENGAMAFDVKNIQPLFMLEQGLPGNSFAFEMARKTGLPEDIVKDAELRAGEGFVGMERNLRKIAASRKALDDKLQRVSKADKTLESITDRYQKELSEIREQRRKILDEAREEAKAVVLAANKEVEKTIRTIKESQASKAETIKARGELSEFLGALADTKARNDEYVERKLRQLEERQERNRQRREQRQGRSKGCEQRQGQCGNLERPALEEKTRAVAEFRNGPMKVGEKVRIVSNGMVGEISKLSGTKAVVTVGNITTRINISQIERISSNEYKEAVRGSGAGIGESTRSSIVVSHEITERKLSFHPEIDIRGIRLNEALDTVMHYIDDAIMLGVPQVRIIHGKGNGILHEEVQKYARTIPAVTSVHDEHIQFGGSGVTIITF